MIIIKKQTKTQKKVLIQRWSLKSLQKIVKTKKGLRINKKKVIKIKGKKQIRIHYQIPA